MVPENAEKAPTSAKKRDNIGPVWKKGGGPICQE
jgi:hypothetical protein